MKNNLLKRTAKLIQRSEQETNDIIESCIAEAINEGYSENEAFKMVMIDLLKCN